MIPGTSNPTRTNIESDKDLKPHIAVIISVVVMLFLSYGITSTLANYEGAQQQMLSQVFPEGLAVHLTWLNLLAQVICVFFLARSVFLGTSVKKGLVLSSILLLLYALYALLVLMNVFDHRPCSCVNIINNLSWSESLIVNSTLFIISTIGVLLFKQRKEVPGKH